MTKRQIYKNITNLSKQELNERNNKITYAKNDVMTTVIKRCRGEKTDIRAIDGFRKNSEKILKFLDVQKMKLNQEQEKCLKNIDPLKNILLGFMKLILIFINIMKKIHIDKNGFKYILFKIDVYFNKFLLAVEIDGKGNTDRDLFFEEK